MDEGAGGRGSDSRVGRENSMKCVCVGRGGGTKPWIEVGVGGGLSETD